MKKTETTLEDLKDRLFKIHHEYAESCSQSEIKKYLDNLEKFLVRLHSAINDYDCIGNLSKKLSNEITSRERGLLDVSSELMFTEGFICNCFDFICYLLVLDHHDLCDVVRKNKYVTNIEDIAKVSMSSKIGFLNQHGFKELTKYHDMEYRNAIAHHNFTIDDNGHLWIKGEKVNVLSKIQNIYVLIGFFDSLFDVLDKESKPMLEQLRKEKKQLDKQLEKFTKNNEAKDV
jgi:hypothetical protein